MTSTARRRRLLPFLATLVIACALAAGSVLYFDTPAPTVSATPEPASPATPPVSVAPPSAPASAVAATALERTAALPPLALPADEAPHGSAMEWWYYSGIVQGDAGERFALHQVVFVANGLLKQTVMHVALTDLRNGRRYVSQSRTGGSPAQAVANGYDFHQADWQVRADGSTHVLRAQAQDARIALDATAKGPLLAHRAADSATPGLLDFGPSGISYYYSRPRMPAQGEITLDGKTVAVRGELWFDHQWGEFDVLTLGWNWFALHLADGSDLMLYQLFDPDTGREVLTAGTLANAQGATPLRAGDIALQAGERWTSPRTAIPYVVGWRIRLPSGELQVRPMRPDSEFDASGTSGNVYWEGPVQVVDAQGGAAGEGFLELSGYDRMAARRVVAK